MRTITWVKMIAAGGVMCIGGPALVYYVMPSEEELFSRYNPDLQKRALANRQQKEENFDQFVTQLKQYSKVDKPIWTVIDQENTKKRQAGVQAELDRRKAVEAEAEARRQEIRDSMK